MDNKQYQITEPYPGWLDEAVNTHEASRLTGVPIATLVTMRSKGGGPSFIRPDQTRLIRYFRRSLYSWLLKNGLFQNTAALNIGASANDNEENT